MIGISIGTAWDSGFYGRTQPVMQMESPRKHRALRKRAWKRTRGFKNGWALVDKGLPRQASKRNTTCDDMIRDGGLNGTWE